MKSRSVFAASLIVTSALVSGCNDNNSPLTPIVTSPTPPPGVPAPTPVPTPMTSISDFVKSLIAMVSGDACNTATPTSLDSVNLVDDMNTTDANALTVNCT